MYADEVRINGAHKCPVLSFIDACATLTNG